LSSGECQQLKNSLETQGELSVATLLGSVRSIAAGEYLWHYRPQVVPQWWFMIKAHITESTVHKRAYYSH